MPNEIEIQRHNSRGYQCSSSFISIIITGHVRRTTEGNVFTLECIRPFVHRYPIEIP